MQEKIDWYQEVVDLEPSSKLFFPLAKMLAEQDVPRAVQTLQRGLDRHPEFIEARFYYVELLHIHKDTADYAERLKEQFAILSPMLSRYAGFWQAWGSNLLDETAQGGQDKALAASFLGVMCAHDTLSFAQIFAAGLRSLAAQEASGEATQKAVPAQKIASAQAQSQSAQAQAKQAPVKAVQTKPAPTIKVTPAQPRTVSGKIEPKAVAQPRIVIKNAESIKKATEKLEQMPISQENDAEESGNDTILSLRTRSMADVLAEQGDYAAALEIYTELMQSAQSADEKQELEAKMVSLEAMGSEPEDMLAEPEVKAPSAGNERVISALGALADRLEARLHS